MEIQKTKQEIADEIEFQKSREQEREQRSRAWPNRKARRAAEAKFKKENPATYAAIKAANKEK